MKNNPGTKANKAGLFFLLMKMISPLLRIFGRLNWRFGRPYRNSLIKEEFLINVKPGMIVLTRKKYELTNLLIPGYWKHAALITGDLQVIHATGNGVTLEGLHEFISLTDDFLFLKPSFCNDPEMNMAAAYIKRFIGFPYNFLLVPTNDSCYCSQLVCKAYFEPGIMKKYTKNVSKFFTDIFGDFPIPPQYFCDSEDFFRVIQAE
jgi:hypothetical protein